MVCPFDWVIARSGVDITRIEHDPPNVLSALWQRSDLGAVTMRGLPITGVATPNRAATRFAIT